MKAQILDKLNELKHKSGKSFEAVHERLGYAVSTVHRWHSGQCSPDLDQLTDLVEFYGGSMDQLFTAVGKQELAAAQETGYQGVAIMAETYEAQIKAKDQQIEYLTAEVAWLRQIITNLSERGRMT